MNDFIKLHIDNNFFIKIIKQGQNFIVKFPKNIFVNKEACVRIYNYNDNKLHVEEFDLQNRKPIKEVVFECEKSIHRILIMMDIWFKAQDIHIPKDLICLYDNDNMIDESTFIEKIVSDMSVEEKKIERFILDNIQDILYNKIDVSQLVGVDKVILYFHNGGLL